MKDDAPVVLPSAARAASPAAARAPHRAAAVGTALVVAGREAPAGDHEGDDRQDEEPGPQRVHRVSLGGEGARINADTRMTALERKRVLIIDDDKHICALLQEALGRTYETEAAQNGAMAFGAILKARPDVILLDINLPGMTGLEILRALKELDSTIPVLVVTGNDTVAVAEDALRNGASAYIPKPFDLRYLDHLVAAALSGTQPPPRR